MMFLYSLTRAVQARSNRSEFKLEQGLSLASKAQGQCLKHHLGLAYVWMAIKSSSLGSVVGPQELNFLRKFITAPLIWPFKTNRMSSWIVVKIPKHDHRLTEKYSG